ncbi:glycosyltransferase [Mucilaginibacter mali]|uniref:Glycosyltransferase n=1 Tax=Mucilaginibacter mali TaxID=2740462 RepID=A0A7D4QFL6_9SPHI|nr:glycosyltransferase [Mucilaginibacter mali]QKJ30452.1 glycosyltransferase [Mucilaginibacter mali]
MRILQINASYKPAYIYGGPTMSVSKLSEHLVHSGCEVQVFTTTANGATELPVHQNTPIEVDGVPVYYFKRITKDHSHFSPSLLKAVWKQVRRFDVVHIHAWWNTVSVLSALVAIMRGVPVIISPRGTLSGYSFNNKNSFFKSCIHHLLGKHLLHRSYIHATSAYEKNNLQQIITAKQIMTIPNFIELPEIAAKTGDFAEPLKLLFFSRIEEKKGLDILLNALVDVIIPWHLTIAGTGDPLYIARLKQLAVQNGIKANISWIGFQNENKFDIIAEHHLMVLPSYDENFGNVVIESLSVGTAVLISRQVGLAGYVTENNLGWICDTNAPSIADAINNMDTDRLIGISNRAPGIIRRDFNEAVLTQQYINMYQQVTTQHG